MTSKITLTVGTPCYDGTVTTSYMKSILTLIGESEKHNVSIRLVTIDKDSLVTRARNNIVRIFMDDPNQSSYLLFVDSDIGFDPAIVWRMMKYNKDITCGIYPKKAIDWERVKYRPDLNGDLLHAYCLDYNLNLKTGDGIRIDDGFGEVLDAATGFMLIKRDVFFRMKEHYPELYYIPEAEVARSENNYAFFDTMIEPETKRYLSEDFTFCRRWQNIGGKIYADILSEFTHTGVYTFKGNIKIQLVKRELKTIGTREVTKVDS